MAISKLFLTRFETLERAVDSVHTIRRRVFHTQLAGAAVGFFTMAAILLHAVGLI